MVYRYKKLPEEILNVIFELLREDSDFASLCQCELVCKNWKIPVQRSLYLRIEFDSVRQVSTLIRSMTCNSNSFPAQFTRWFVFNVINPNDQEEYSWINSLSDIFPNVRSVFNAKVNMAYYQDLIRAHTLGRWINMKSIGTCHRNHVFLHNTCALLHQSTLKNLHLYDSNHLNYNLYEKLNLFASVKKLYIETDNHNFFESAENATINMSKLKLLYYEILKNTDTNSFNPYHAVKLSLIEPQPNIKDLSIEGTSYENDNYLLYLMKKFPNLKQIRINENYDPILYHGSLLERIKSAKNNFSLPVLAQFMSFVSKCDWHYIKLLYTTINSGDLLRSYWNLCGPKIPGILGLLYAKEVDFPNPYEDNSKSRVRISMNVQPLLNANSITFTYKPVGTDLPHLDVLEQCGKEIIELFLCIGYFRGGNILHSEQNPKLLEMVNGNFFNHAIQYCVKLKTLCVFLSRILIFNPNQDLFINTSITNLTLEHVEISKNILTQISYQIPSLTTLTMRDIHYIESEIEPISHKFNTTINMPLSSFHILSVENYLIDNGCSCHDMNEICIKISTKDGNQFYKYTSYMKINSTNKYDDEDDDDNNDDENDDTSYGHAVEIDEYYYNTRLYDTNCSTLHVKCKSVKTLEVSMEKINPSLRFMISQ